jgi:hypothetical protein
MCYRVIAALLLMACRPAASQVVVRPEYVVSGDPGTNGYLRYGYLLMRRPADAVLIRVLQVLARDAGTSPVPGQSAAVLNLLVQTPPPSGARRSWLTENYDYKRSDGLLDGLGVPASGGPFIAVSERSLLGPAPDLAGAQLFDVASEPQSGTPAWLAALKTSSDLQRGVEFTGRDFLGSGAREKSGYGLYSYVLLGEHPDPANRESYRAIIDAYLQIDDIRRFEADNGVDKKQLNITYVPLRQAAPEDPNTSWVLDHYDYAAAQVLLRKLMGDSDSSGAYLVSYDQPLLSASEVDRRRLLVQNLSGLPANVAFLWFREFKTQVRQSRYWDDKTIRQFMLKMRTQIAMIAGSFSGPWLPRGDTAAFATANIRIER